MMTRLPFVRYASLASLLLNTLFAAATPLVLSVDPETGDMSGQDSGYCEIGVSPDSVGWTVPQVSDNGSATFLSRINASWENTHTGLNFSDDGSDWDVFERVGEF